jgi:hypothetical protein
MITCVSSVLLLTKWWTYTFMFPPMKHYCFIDSVCDSEFRTTYGPTGGSV